MSSIILIVRLSNGSEFSREAEPTEYIHIQRETSKKSTYVIVEAWPSPKCDGVGQLATDSGQSGNSSSQTVVWQNSFQLGGVSLCLLNAFN